MSQRSRVRSPPRAFFLTAPASLSHTFLLISMLTNCPQIINISHVMKMTQILLLLLIGLTATHSHQLSCLLEEPLTNQCLLDIDFHMVEQTTLPYLCVITYERGLFEKAEDLCREATGVDLESAYRYFKVLLINGQFGLAFRTEYSLFFSNPFTHNKQLLLALDEVSPKIKAHADKLHDLPSFDNFTEAIFRFYNNQTEKSLTTLKAHLATNNPEDLIFEHFLMARILESQYQYYEGLTYLTKVIESNKRGHPYLHHLLGNFLMHHVQFQKAINSFEKANSEFHRLYKSNGFSFSNYNIGLCYQKLGKVEDALKYFEKSVVNLPSAEALNAVGHAHFVLGQNGKKEHFQEASKFYQKAIQADQSYTVAVFNLGMLELTLNKSKEATKYFENCLKMEQTFRSCKYGILKTHYKLKQKDQIQPLIDSIEKNEETLAELAALLYEMGDYKRAIKLLGDKDDYRSSELMEWKGFNEYALDRFEQASKSFSRAIFLGAKKGYVYYSLGLAQLELKYYSECVRSFENAYKLDPRPQTKQKLEHCRKSAPSDL